MEDGGWKTEDGKWALPPSLPPPPSLSKTHPPTLPAAQGSGLQLSKEKRKHRGREKKGKPMIINTGLHN